VAGRVGDDEPAFGRGEKAVGNVNSDALFAFGAQAVGEIGQVIWPAPVMSADRSSASSWSSIRFLES